MEIKELKIDFGSGYNPNSDYKTCDITNLPNLDYVYNQDKNTIVGLDYNSVDEFYLRNVVHHLKNLENTFSCLIKHLKNGGIIKIIDVRKEEYQKNVILDIIWYRYVIPRYEIFFSKKYRDYFNVLNKLNLVCESYYIKEEKEVSVWRKL